MCLVNLNRSVLECGHSWFQLIEPCSPSTTLSTCPGKMSINGWENKLNCCPHCTESNKAETNSTLLGTESHQWQLSPASSQIFHSRRKLSLQDGINHDIATRLPLSRRPSLTTGVLEARKLSRHSAISNRSGIDLATSAGIGPVGAAGIRNAGMNARLESYWKGQVSWKKEESIKKVEPKEERNNCDYAESNRQNKLSISLRN